MGILGLSKKQKESVQFDYGLLYTNYGKTSQINRAPLSGGSKVELTYTIYDIPYEGRKGKTKGMQIITDIEVKISTNMMDTDLANIKEVILPWATATLNADVVEKISVGPQNLGVVPDESYLENITLFVKRLDGKYQKITLYNPMNESGFSIEAKDGAEGMIPVEIYGHLDTEDTTQNLMDIEILDAIADPPQA